VLGRQRATLRAPFHLKEPTMKTLLAALVAVPFVLCVPAIARAEDKPAEGDKKEEPKKDDKKKDAKKKKDEKKKDEEKAGGW
jgi:hypothetical protein